MSDPILLFLIVDAVALLSLGVGAVAIPRPTCGFLAAMLSGLGMLLCLAPLLTSAPPTTLGLPVGPPGLSLHLALDSLSAFFLVIVFLAGTALAAFQATAIPSAPTVSVGTTTSCLAGAVLSLLAADGVTLAIGVAIMCGAIWLRPTARLNPAALLTPILLLAAVCLLTPAGFAPNFDAIRAAPVDPNHATAAAALTFAAVAAMTGSRSVDRCWTRNALSAGMLIPAGSYLLLRFIADLAGAATQTGCGFLLLLAGGVIAVTQAWRSASHPDLDVSLTCMANRQAGLAMVGVGLALIAHAADLPSAEAFALAATFLSALTGSLAGVLTTLAVQAVEASAGAHRLSRLGGLIHTMPVTSAALAAGLLALSAIPPGLGFASLWLLFQAILSAPRTGGLMAQLPLGIIGAIVALSAALTTAASVRLIGVALLGRPRTLLAAGAQEEKSPSQVILLVLTGLSILAGVLPGPALWILADPAIRALTGVPPGTRIGLALLLPSIASPSYLALPVVALLVLATGAAMLVPRWWRREAKAVGLWGDGMPPPAGLPFGEPAAQSVGQGFLPILPNFPLSLPDLTRLPQISLPQQFRWPSATAGLWLLLAAFGVMLLAMIG